MKRSHDQGYSSKGKHLIGTGFRGSLHYQNGRRPGSVQEGMALEELRILHLVGKANMRRLLSSKQLG